MPRLPPAPEIDWSNAAAPGAAAFDDVYFSREGGLEEARAVFLAGCGLPDAWRGRDCFAVAELGFGSGLNVLAAWFAWKKTRSPHAVLHVSSIEAFPLARADAARLLAFFPEVSDLAALLLERWPVRAAASQRIWVPEDGFALTLHTGDAGAVLAGWDAPADAWFLDGFAPARNAAMWSPEVLAHVGRLSRPGTRLATFTVAGEVRRGLEAAGFAVEKRPGFANKRERLEGRFHGARQPQRSIYPRGARYPKRVAILGAGVAGAACAHALMRRGVETVVLDAAPALGAGASGNPAGLVMPRLDRGDTPAREVYLAAYLHAVAAYVALGEDVFLRCGVEERASAKDAAALADLLGDPPLPPHWFAATAEGAALHAQAGVVRPQRAIAAWLAGATLMCEAPVQTLERAGDSWVLRAPDGYAVLKAAAVVLACGAALKHFAPASFLPIGLSRGQIEWGEGRSPKHAIASGNYVAPFEGGVLFGATFDKTAVAADPEPLTKSRAQNVAALAELAPEIAASLGALQSRAALRVTAPDRMPVAGLMPDAQAWRARYAGLAHGRRLDTSQAPPAYDGVYVIGALGARGLTLAPLLGEEVAAEMCGEPPILSRRAREAIHPARFLHRALKRR